VGIAQSAVKGCRFNLTSWGWMLAGEPVPAGRARRGAKPPVVPIAVLDDPALPEELTGLLAVRSAELGVTTVAHELFVARNAVSWWQRQGWIAGDPTSGIEWPPTPPDLTSALPDHQVTAPRPLDVERREEIEVVALPVAPSVQSARPTLDVRRFADLCQRVDLDLLTSRPVLWRELFQLSETELTALYTEMLALHRGLRSLLNDAPRQQASAS
jgi:hypothetical protein